MLRSDVPTLPLVHKQDTHGDETLGRNELKGRSGD